MPRIDDLRTHPAFLHCGTLIPLSGFSGALIGLLVPDGGIRRVRKAAATAAESDKLRRQAECQRRLTTFLAPVASVPEILSEGVANGCYWFDMEYVVGVDAIRHLHVGTPDRVDGLIIQLTAVLDAHLAVPRADRPMIELAVSVAGKLDEIDRRTGARHRGVTDAIRSRLADADVQLAPNFAHGDLTLENILVDRRRRLWIIDTIESPFDHYWIDLAKLFQDLEGRWFQRRGRTLSLGATWTLRQRLMRYAVERDPRYRSAHPVLLALTFARILPYCQSSDDVDFVTGKAMAAIESRPTLAKEMF